MLGVASPSQLYEGDRLAYVFLGATFFKYEIKVMLAAVNVSPSKFLTTTGLTLANCVEVEAMFLSELANGLLHQVLEEGANEFTENV